MVEEVVPDGAGIVDFKYLLTIIRYEDFNIIAG
jgi:hypothetical protein